MSAEDQPHPAVLQHVIQYFKNAFPNSPPAAFKPDLEIRKAFKPKTWKALADAFNDSAWMKAMDRSITQQQMGEAKVKTIFDVALLITNTAGKRVKFLTGVEFKSAPASHLKLKGVQDLNL